MHPENRHYIITESCISAIINAGFSALFTWLAFSSYDAVALWGNPGLAMDFVPQTFMVTLFSVLAPGLITRKRLRAGALKPTPEINSKLPNNILLRAILLAVIATLVCSSTAVFLLSLFVTEAMALAQVYLLKIAYGITVSLIFTPIGLRAVLAEK